MLIAGTYFTWNKRRIGLFAWQRQPVTLRMCVLYFINSSAVIIIFFFQFLRINLQFFLHNISIKSIYLFIYIYIYTRWQHAFLFISEELSSNTLTSSLSNALEWITIRHIMPVYGWRIFISYVVFRKNVFASWWWKDAKREGKREKKKKLISW